MLKTSSKTQNCLEIPINCLRLLLNTYLILAAPWRWDTTGLDLFDCRSTEWFIDAATMSKNVLIMLDLSGSMLGQRFEIAKQTIEAIMDTLYDNDFFNVMAVSY